MIFSYKGCEFDVGYYDKLKGGSAAVCWLTLKKVNGSVLEIPNTYDEYSVEMVSVDIIFLYRERDAVLDYFEPESDHFSFYSVEEIHIPESVKSIQLNRRIFPNLKRVFVDPKNEYYKAFDHYLFCCNDHRSLSKDYSLVAYYDNDEDLEEFIVPDTVRRIEKYAFSFTKLCSIVIPDTVSCDSIESFVYSKWLESFNSVITVNGITLAVRDSTDEFVIDNTNLCSTVFKYGEPKKIILDVEGLCGFSKSIYISNGTDCVELRNSKIVLKEFHDLLRYTRSVIVNPESENYFSLDGVLFSKDRKILLMYPSLKEDRKYTVPEGVIEIAQLAFCNNRFCEVIQLPTTLKRLHRSSITQMAKLTEIIFPELDSSFRFESINLYGIERLKIPASISALQQESFYLYGASVDATEIQYFGYKSVVCRELFISEKMKYAAKGALCGAMILYTPAYNMYNFAETLFSSDEELRKAGSITLTIIVTRENGNVLHLAVPVLRNIAYQEAIFRFWSIDGIDLKKYVDALLKIRETSVRNSVFISCIENNSDNTEFIELLFGSLNRIINNLVTWAIKEKRFNSVVMLCKRGLIKVSLAKKLLRGGNLPKELTPVFMELLKSCKEKETLSL